MRIDTGAGANDEGVSTRLPDLGNALSVVRTRLHTPTTHPVFQANADGAIALDHRSQDTRRPEDPGRPGEEAHSEDEAHCARPGGCKAMEQPSHETDVLFAGLLEGGETMDCEHQGHTGEAISHNCGEA